MAKLQSPAYKTQLRFLVACPRSGSTLLMRVFAESPVCAVTSRLILMGNSGEQSGFSPDYSILETPCSHSVYIKAAEAGKRLLINREELGNNSSKGECLYDICPSPSAYAMIRPVFMVRDPIQVFDSWKNVGWMDEQSLVHCYTNLFHMLRQAPAHAISCLLYEHLIQHPEREIKRICARWGVPYSGAMLDFKKPFGTSFLFASDREKSIYLEDKPLNLFRTVESKSSIESDVPYHGLLSNAEKDDIENKLGGLYLHCWGNDILRLRTILAEKAWIGFDLDDTLHEFRISSGAATNKVLQKISERFSIPIPALKEEYSAILKETTANAFSDGKTSFDCRRERFTFVLSQRSLPVDSNFMDELLEMYEATLMGSLELKCGALGLLSTLRNMGKKIVIMTEGPQDAQERTVQGLGISQYIDFLATTNFFGVSKTGGLFSKVLDHLGVPSGDIAYIGDNEDRDIKPAMAEGIFSIHFAETKHISLNAFPVQINTLNKLNHILLNTGS